MTDARTLGRCASYGMELDPLAGMRLRGADDLSPSPGGPVARALRGVGSAGMALLVLGGCGGAADRSAGAPVGTETGNRAPELQGTLAGGGDFHLASDTRGAVIVEFYRGSYCGLCRMHLASLEQNLAHFQKRGVEVVAATGESPPPGVSAGEPLEISFPTVRVDSSTLRRWGVVDAEGSRGGTATFVLDRHGVIRFRHIGRNAGDRPSDAELLTVVEQMANE